MESNQAEILNIKKSFESIINMQDQSEDRITGLEDEADAAKDLLSNTEKQRDKK